MKSVTMLSQIRTQICPQKLHEHLGNVHTHFSQPACKVTAKVSLTQDVLAGSKTATFNTARIYFGSQSIRI